MKREEATRQIEAFFRKLGMRASFSNEQNFVKASVGEAVLGFEFDESEEILKAKALIYRFRNAPKPEILDAVYDQAKEANSGGGQMFFDENDMTLYLEKDFVEPLGDENFHKQINILAQASFFWSSRKLQQVAETAARN